MKFLKIIEKYYRAQTFIDLGWGEFSWFNNSLVDLMAIIYVLEKTGVIIEGTVVYYILFGAFFFFYIFGRLLKRFGIYDRSMYVEADIDPVQKKILKAAEIVIEDSKKKLEREINE